MRHLILFILISELIAGCQKEVTSNKDQIFMDRVKLELQSKISATDLSLLDLAGSLRYHEGTDSIYFLRIPFRNKNIQQDFVLLQTNPAGDILKGKVIHLERNLPVPVTGYRYDGSIRIESLDHADIVQSDIVNGYILAFHSALRTDVLPGVPEMPEVIMFCTANSTNSGISYSDWISLQSLFDNINYSGYYSDLSGGGGGGSIGGSSGSGNSGGSGSGATAGVILNGNSVSVDYDTYVSHPAIDISSYLKCFGSIPDAGASCSITIYTDIPVNGDPSEFFNWQTGSPGHTFLSFSKSNGGQSVQQVFGWYPSQSWEAMTTPAPIDGKFVDDAGHEFNASLTMTVTPSQLQDAITEVLYLSHSIKYDVDEYNCTDFALQIFNLVRDPRNVIEIPMYDIPGGMAPNGTATPNGLYDKLKDMKAANGADAANINLPLVGWAGNGHGACN